MDENAITYLQHLHNHLNDIPRGVLRPVIICLPNGATDLRKDAKSNIFQMKFGQHGKGMISAQQAVLACRNSPENPEMLLPFVSEDNDANDDIVTISRSGSALEGVLMLAH